MRKQELENGVARLLNEIEAEDAFARIEDNDLEPWEELSFSTVTPEEIEALEREGTDNHTAACRFEAFRPLDNTAKARLLEGVQRQLLQGQRAGSQALPQVKIGTGAFSALRERSSSKTVDGEESEAPVRHSDEGPAKPQAGRRAGIPSDISADGELEGAEEDEVKTAHRSRLTVLDFRRPGSTSRPRRRWLSASVAALAAAMLWIVIWPKAPNTLPSYELSAESTTRKMRSHGEESIERESLSLEPDETFAIVLRPQHAVGHDVDAIVFVQRGSDLEPVDLRAEISQAGSIRLQGRFDASLRGGDSNVELWVVVAARGSIPDPGQILDATRGDITSDGEMPWRLLQLTLKSSTGDGL